MHAARRLRERLDNGPPPARVVSTGFAGALSGGVPLGAWISAHALFEWRDGTLSALASVSPLVEAPKTFECLPCDVVSTTRLVGRDSPLRRLESSRPLVADMESAALAREAAARAIAFSVLRLISDTPDHPLPEFLEPFTAAMAGADARARVLFTARGVGSALTDPLGVARLVSTGRSLTKQLGSDFARLARLLDP
jgi:nucleoside phosphorylase